MGEVRSVAQSGSQRLTGYTTSYMDTRLDARHSMSSRHILAVRRQQRIQRLEEELCHGVPAAKLAFKHSLHRDLASPFITGGVRAEDIRCSRGVSMPDGHVTRGAQVGSRGERRQSSASCRRYIGRYIQNSI